MSKLTRSRDDAKDGFGKAETILFCADLGSVHIHTGRYNAALVESPSAQASVTLTGMRRMFLIEHNFVGFSQPHINYYVQDLDMNGFSITVERASFTPAGPQFELRLDLPESWTRQERIAAVCGNAYSGLDFLALLDEQILPSYMYQSAVTKQIFANDSDPFLTASRSFSNFAIAPSEWNHIKTITFIPYTARPLELTLIQTLNGQQVYRKAALQPGTIITQDAMDDSQDVVMWDDCQQDIMWDCAISISLDTDR
ncbi:MAG: hypothetical protein Q4C13_04155 [Clostridia bacterium]|nr:hypothetical protein [Clostridia bacterium]